MNGYSHVAAASAENGAILMEVLVAVVLVGLLVGPLTGSVVSALDAAASVQRRAEQISPAAGSEGGRAWDWGPRVVSATWRPGPVLDIATTAPSDSGPLVGVWLSGWFLGEKSSSSGGLVSLRASNFHDATGEEVIVRVREPEGPWGPPWRSVVPDAAGSMSTPAAIGAGPEGQTAGEAVSVLHVPGLGNPLVKLSWSSDMGEAEPPGAPLVLPRPGKGRCDAALADSTQTWWMEPGRAVDLYF